MAVSFEQFMEATGAELVGGNIVVGFAADRRKVGDVSSDGVFNLNDDGKSMADDIEAGQKPVAKSTRKTKAEPAPEADPRLADPT